MNPKKVQKREQWNNSVKNSKKKSQFPAMFR